MKRTMTTIGLFTLAVLFIAGCASDPVSGTIRAPGGVGLGSAAPDIPFTTPEGKQTSLRKVNQKITILAFTTPGKEGCSELKPEMVTLAKRFDALPVTVVQVAVPTHKCPHGPGCMQVAHPKADFIALCDDDRIAWNAYGEPEPNTAFLIGESGRVRSIAGLDNLSTLVKKAEKMGQEIVERHQGT